MISKVHIQRGTFHFKEAENFISLRKKYKIFYWFLFYFILYKISFEALLPYPCFLLLINFFKEVNLQSEISQKQIFLMILYSFMQVQVVKCNNQGIIIKYKNFLMLLLLQRDSFSLCYIIIKLLRTTKLSQNIRETLKGRTTL